MLKLEDLLVANQAARQGLVPGETLRALLHRLDQRPDRVQLVRFLHERAGVPFEAARGLYQGAQRYLRQRGAEHYLTLLRRDDLVPPGVLDPIARKQAAAGFAWSLGERLVRQQLLPSPRHQSLLEESVRALEEEERRLLEENRSQAFAPVLGGAGVGPRPSPPPGSAPGPTATPLSPTPARPGPTPAPGAPAHVPGVTIRMDPKQILGIPGAETADPDAGTSLPIPGGPAGQPPDSEATMTLDAGDIAGLKPESDGLPRGTRVGERYVVRREIGRGAMGVVYLVDSEDHEGPLALKLVQGEATEEARGRFEREIKLSARISHPNVIQVLDAGTRSDGSTYMVMEFLPGESLQRVILRDGPQPIARSLDLLEQVLSGLEAIHRCLTVHRDLKPENLQLLRGEDGRDRVKIMDFGIARLLDTADEGANLFMTVKGSLSGTPQYVAPEAILEPELIEPSHDIYACGVILYELLTADLPFKRNRSLRDLLSDTVSARARPLDEAHPAGAPHPAPLERLVRRLLDKDPAARPRDAGAALAFLAEIREELANPRPTVAAPAAAAGEAGLVSRFFGGIRRFFGGSSEGEDP